MRPAREMVRLSAMSEAQRRDRYADRLFKRLHHRHHAALEMVASVERVAGLLAVLDRASRTGSDADRLRAEIGQELGKLGRADPLSGLLNGFSGIDAIDHSRGVTSRAERAGFVEGPGMGPAVPSSGRPHLDSEA